MRLQYFIIEHPGKIRKVIALMLKKTNKSILVVSINQANLLILDCEILHVKSAWGLAGGGSWDLLYCDYLLSPNG